MKESLQTKQTQPKAGRKPKQTPSGDYDSDQFMYANEPRNMSSGFTNSMSNLMRANTIEAMRDNPARRPAGTDNIYEAQAYNPGGQYAFQGFNAGISEAVGKANQLAAEEYAKKQNYAAQRDPPMQVGIGMMHYNPKDYAP